MSGSIKLTRATGSGGGAGCGVILDEVVQQVPHRNHILSGCYNAGSHNAFLNDFAFVYQGASFGPDVRKGYGGEWSGAKRDIEFPEAKRFWDVVRVYARRLLGT